MIIKLKFIAVAITMLSIVELCNAQTNPTPQSLPYSQNFTSLAHTATTFPVGWQAWNLSTAGSGATFKTIVPPASSDLFLTASSNASIITDGAHNYNGKIGFFASSTSDPSLCLAINTTGFFNVSVTFDIMTLRNPHGGANNRINQVDLQYRVGTSAIFSTVTGIATGTYQNITTNQTTAVTTPQNNIVRTFTLPATCNNQPIVQVRWVQRDFSGANERPSFAIDNVVVCTSQLTPTINITGSTSFCNGGSSNFLATITNGGAAPIFQWKKNNVNIATGSSVNLTGLVASDQITCVLTSTANCLTSNVVTSNTITIATVNPSPTISSATLTPVSCAGLRNGAIDITIAGGTSPYTIAWDTANIVTGNIFGVTVGPKTATNPLVGQGNTNTYFISGVEARVLNLVRGINYSFSVLTPSHPFFFSTILNGGNSNGLITLGQTGAPTQSGTVNFKPNISTPNLVYYPCQFHTFMGWQANIANGVLAEDISNLRSGIYNAVVTDANGCTVSPTYTITQNATCSLTLNLKAFIQGLYTSPNSMQPVLFNNGMSTNPNASDSITIEIRQPTGSFNLVQSKSTIINTNGTASVIFTNAVLGNSYYIVVKHRNSIETWSKNPLLFNASPMIFSFTGN